MAALRPLRGARVCSRNALPLDTGAAWGRPRERGRSRETGPSRGYLAPAGGARRRHGRATGQPVRRASISYMDGPCLILPGRSVFCQTGTSATAGTPAAMTPVAAKSRREVPRAVTDDRRQ